MTSEEPPRPHGHRAKVSAILLAAGRSTRMGQDKLAICYRGEPLLRRALAPLVECALFDEVIVVVNPLCELPLQGRGCTVVVNPEYRSGMGSSLRAGVLAADETTEAYLIALGDMPEISAELLKRLVEAFLASERAILLPVHEDQPGHPVIISRSFREELLEVQGDLGAREIIRRHPESVSRFPTDQRAVVFDVDTPEDLTSPMSPR